MTRRINPTGLLLLLAACLLAWPSEASAKEYDLKDYNAGSYVMGPKLSGKAIKGKVVVIKFWGTGCAPCIQAIPDTTELIQKNGKDKLVVIANQSWSSSDGQVEDVWKKHAKNNSVMVVNGGELKGYKPKSFPRAMIFDHTGKSVWEGSYGAMGRALKQALNNVPDIDEAAKDAADTGPLPIITGLDPEYFLGEVRMINSQTRRIDSTLAKLRRAAERSSRAAQKDEAKAIVKAVEVWAKQQQSDADVALASDPATAYTLAGKLVTLLDDDELAEDANGIIEKIEKDDALFDNVRATIALRGIVAEAKSIGLDKDKSVVDDRDNSRSVRLITRDLSRLIKAYPDTDAGQEAKSLQSDWGLDG